MKPREARGLWWSPHRPDDKVAGTLTFTPGETLVLRTIGKLHSRVSPTPEGTILIGNTNEGAVTLFRCGDDSSPLMEKAAQVADAVEWDYYTKFALFGHHFDRPEDIAFTNLGVSLNNIEDWTIGGRFGLPEESGDTVTLRYDALPRFAATLDNFQVAVRDAPSGHIRLHRETRLERGPYFRIESETPIPLECLLNGPVHALHNLVAFGLGIRVAVKWLRTVLPTTPGKTIVEVVFTADEPPEHAQRHQIESLFTLPDIVDSLESTLRGWFGLPERIAPVLDLYFGVLYDEPSMRQPHQFLSLAQALESFHREMIHPKRMNLVDRLSDLVAQAPPTIVGQAIRSPKDFVEVVRDTRNYFTHYERKHFYRAAFGLDLLNLIERMRWLLEGLLLQQLALPADAVETLVRRNERLKRVGTARALW